jgi:chromosome segregation ATPase
MFKVEISEEQFEEALLRHEEAFDKELEGIKTDEKELRKMILKMKKSIIEQSRQNNSTYKHAVHAIEDVRTLNRKVEGFQNSVNELTQRVEQCTETFAKAIGVIQQYESNRKKEEGFFKGLWEFIKNLWKS